MLEADLGWIVGWDKPSFIGHERLREQRTAGVIRLVGFEMIDRGIARHGYAVQRDGVSVGVVTSGTQTPFLKKAIGMAYVPVEMLTGLDLTIDVRGRPTRRVVLCLTRGVVPSMAYPADRSLRKDHEWIRGG